MLLHHSPDLHKVISYNIACQWSKHLLEWLKALPWKVWPKNVGSYITVISKLHVNAHNPCPTNISLNYIDGAGHTDGEAIEHTHVMTGQLNGSTKQMAPGFHHDMLDTHWKFWTWQNIVSFGEWICFYKLFLHEVQSNHRFLTLQKALCSIYGCWRTWRPLWLIL